MQLTACCDLDHKGVCVKENRDKLLKSKQERKRWEKVIGLFYFNGDKLRGEIIDIKPIAVFRTFQREHWGEVCISSMVGLGCFKDVEWARGERSNVWWSWKCSSPRCREWLHVEAVIWQQVLEDIKWKSRKSHLSSLRHRVGKRGSSLLF